MEFILTEKEKERANYQIGMSYPLFGRMYQAVHTYLCISN